MPLVSNPPAAKPSLHEDFEISIEPRSADGKFPVRAEWRGSSRTARGRMVFPIDEPKWQNWLNIWQNAPSRSDQTTRHLHSMGELPTNSGIQELGQNLFAALFGGEVRDLYRLLQDHVRQTDKRLRLKLCIHAPDLAVLPWEFLYDDDYDHDYIALTHTATLVRTVDTTLPVQMLTSKSRLRILGMAAAPHNLPPLNIQKEKELVEDALHDLRTPVDAAVDLIWVKGQTWPDLERDLRANWHVFHFIGHSAFDKKHGSLVLVGQDGQSASLSADALARELKRLNSVRLVVLNSCEGALGSTSDIFSSIATTLIRQGITAVLAMQSKITDRAAIEFSRALYTALARGESVATAVAEARRNLYRWNPHSTEWAVPVLYMRGEDGPILEPFQFVPERPSEGGNPSRSDNPVGIEPDPKLLTNPNPEQTSAVRPRPSLQKKSTLYLGLALAVLIIGYVVYQQNFGGWLFPTTDVRLSPTTQPLVLPNDAPTTASTIESLVGHWTFDECGDTRRVVDSSELNNIGLLSGSVEFISDGVLGCALDFKTVEAAVIIPHSPSLEPITGTIAVWVRLTKLPNTGEHALILGKTNESTAAYLLSVNSDGSVKGQVNGVSTQTPANLITPEHWHYITLSWDESFMSVYVDGRERADPQPATPAYTGATNFVLSPVYVTTTDKFIGQLDELRFYDRALNDQEILQDYELGTFKCTNVTEILLNECEALVALYNSTGGATTWYTDTYWLEPGTSPCNWYQVVCGGKDESGFRHIEELNLLTNGLNGAIPTAIGDLQELRKLVLTGEYRSDPPHNSAYTLRGPLPESMGSLKKLEVLNLAYNDGITPNDGITDAIPGWLGNLTNLKELSLAYTNFKGKIPRSLFALNELASINLDSTQISDTIPAELGDPNLLPTLYLFYLNSPHLTGEIPSTLAERKALSQLMIRSNQKLTGSIDWLSRSKKDNWAFIQLKGGGGLSGDITGVIEKLALLKQFQTLELVDDGLTGSIPPSIIHSPNLQDLWIGGKQITGTIPDEIGNISTLKDLRIQHTQIHGTIPSSLGNRKNLLTLWLHHNQLTGLVPSTFITINLPNLINLDLGYNSLNAMDPEVLNFLAQKDSDWAQTQKYDVVGYWQFDECDGNVVNDASGLENHGNLQGAVAFTTDGVSGCALQFSAEGGQDVIAHSPSLEPITGTIIAWIKVDKLPEKEVAILGKTSDLHVNQLITGSATVYDLRMTSDGAVIGAVFDDKAATSEWSKSTSQPNLVTPGTWHQIALRWDGNTVSVSIDGLSKPEWAQLYKPIPGIGLSYHGRAPLILGVYSTYGLGNFTGKLDDLRFYARALSNEEIQSNYQLYAGSVVTPSMTICPSVSEISSKEFNTVIRRVYSRQPWSSQIVLKRI